MPLGEDSLKLGRGAGAAPGGVGATGGKAGEKAEIIEKDSELHQRGVCTAGSSAGARLCVDGAEATMRSERDVFRRRWSALMMS